MSRIASLHSITIHGHRPKCSVTVSMRINNLKLSSMQFELSNKHKMKRTSLKTLFKTVSDKELTVDFLNERILNKQNGPAWNC